MSKANGGTKRHRNPGAGPRGKTRKPIDYCRACKGFGCSPDSPTCPLNKYGYSYQGPRPVGYKPQIGPRLKDGFDKQLDRIRQNRERRLAREKEVERERDRRAEEKRARELEQEKAAQRENAVHGSDEVST